MNNQIIDLNNFSTATVINYTFSGFINIEDLHNLGSQLFLRTQALIIRPKNSLRFFWLCYVAFFDDKKRQ